MPRTPNAGLRTNEQGEVFYTASASFLATATNNTLSIVFNGIVRVGVLVLSVALKGPRRLKALKRPLRAVTVVVHIRAGISQD